MVIDLNMESNEENKQKNLPKGGNLNNLELQLSPDDTQLELKKQIEEM